MYKLETEILETHEALLSVEMEESELQTAMHQAARDISRKVRIPGFRKGRAPYGKVLRYVGEDHIKQEAIDTLLETVYPDLIKESGITPYKLGSVEDLNFDPLTFKIRVPLIPEVTLGDYQSIRQDWDPPQVNDEEIVEVLEQVREEHATEEVVERPCQYGDLVYIDILGVVEEEEGKRTLIDKDNQAFLLNEDDPFLTQAFYDEVVGLEAADEKTFTITLPETLEDESLRNVEATFDVIINKVCTYSLPDLDDALANNIGNFETIEALKEDIHHRLLEFKTQKQEDNYQERVMKALVEQADVRYPPVLLEETLDDMVKEYDQSVRQKHNLSLEDALRLEGQTLTNFRESLMVRAKERLASSLVLGEFARKEEIEADDSEVQDAYAELLKSLGGLLEEAPELDLNSELGHNLRQNTLGRKVIEHLVAIARGEVATETPTGDETETIAVYDEDETPTEDA